MDIYETIRSNLKRLRTSNGLTQQELSEKIQVPRANLGRYETGENIPQLDILVKFADFFDVSVDELLGREK